MRVAVPLWWLSRRARGRCRRSEVRSDRCTAVCGGAAGAAEQRMTATSGLNKREGKRQREINEV